MNRIVLPACLIALGVAAAVAAQDDRHTDHDHDDRGDHGDHDDAPADHVPLDAATRDEFGIEVGVAGPDTVRTYLTLPGEVLADEDHVVHLVPRYPGIVTEVRAQVGDRVAKGQVLAIVESDESLAPFAVKTLLGGTVIGKHLSLGEAVSRDRDAFVIADLSTVWVDLTVYPRDLARVRTGQPVQILVGHDPAPDRGTIGYVSPVVDGTTRTATARVVLDNRDGRWRPGMFVRGKVLVDGTAARVAVPPTALHTLEGSTVVFVETAGGFAPRPVRVGRAGDAMVEVADGLEPGERYVRRGGFPLQAELGRDALGHAGHAH